MVNDIEANTNEGGYVTHVAVVGKFHILSKIQAFDGGYVSEVKKPNVSQNLAFEDKAGHNAPQDVNVDLQIGSGIHQSQLTILSV